MAALRGSIGNLPTEVTEAIRSQPGLLERATRLILDSCFPASLHNSILEAVGLSLDLNEESSTATSRRRDPSFRRDVLLAYEHRCAVTGFRAALGGAYFGVEAAHVQWHAYGGPDTVTNGLTLNPLMHLLFDRGAWSLTDDRHIIVSAEFTGTDEATDSLRDLYGKPLRKPLPGYESVSVDFIRWHREPKAGGVFRGPALS